MSLSANRQQIRRVLIVTLILNLLVAGGKIVLGVVTGALAIAADGIHSLTDSAGNITGLVANHYADQPPDDEHPYGHRRFETLAALSIGGLLLLTAWEMIQGALDRLLSDSVPQLTPLAFAVMLLTLLVNLFVSRYQTRRGQALRSEILLADARNTRADVFVTLSVLVSMALVSITGFGWIDVVAALIVVVLITRAALQIVGQTGGVLVDRAPYPPQELRDLILSVPSVERVSRVRSRGTAAAAHIDVDVSVSPAMTADHTAQITRAIGDKLHDELDGIQEIEVHFVPQSREDSDCALIARACGDALGLATHEVTISETLEGKTLELHVEVPAQQTLAEAHTQVSQLEAQIRSQLPDVVRVITHIEPMVTTDIASADQHLQVAADHIETQSRGLLRVHYPRVDWHDFLVCPVESGFALTVHAMLPAQITIEAAHDIAEEAEMLLRGKIINLSRVTIHTEPFDH